MPEGCLYVCKIQTCSFYYKKTKKTTKYSHFRWDFFLITKLIIIIVDNSSSGYQLIN